MQLSEAHQKAAGELIDLVVARVGTGRAVHPETAIACTARLAGSLLFRSFHFNVQGQAPGTVVLSNEANVEGPQLVSLLSRILQLFAVPLDKTKLGGELAQRGTEPNLSVVESLALLQDDALHIARSHRLGLKDAARAATMATAFLVKEASRDIGGEVGFNVAVYGFIEGTKTVPPHLRATCIPERESKPWFKFW